MQKLFQKDNIYRYKFSNMPKKSILFMNTNIYGKDTYTRSINNNFRMKFTSGDLGRVMKTGPK